MVVVDHYKVSCARGVVPCGVVVVLRIILLPPPPAAKVVLAVAVVVVSLLFGGARGKAGLHHLEGRLHVRVLVDRVHLLR